MSKVTKSNPTYVFTHYLINKKKYLKKKIVTNNFFSFQSLETELVCSTAYMELFIRRITEPKLLAIFLRFLFTEMHDQDTIIDIMVHRLTLQSQVSKTFTIFSISEFT